MEFKRQNHQQMGTSSLPNNPNLEQNSLFSPSTLSPNSMGLMSMDNNNPHPSLYNPSAYYPHQPGYRSFDSNRSQPPSHESHTGISTPIFEEFLTPPPSYLSMSNTSLSIHSHMNGSFQETANNNNPSTMTSTNSFNHHNTMYPY